MLFGLQKQNRFTVGLGEKLPVAYRKFYAEWKLAKPTAVHFIPKEGQFERDEVTGLVKVVQNVPLPVIYPPEHNEGIWGGEGVIKGYQKRSQTKRRVPHYWVPVLRRSVVHSQVLDKYMTMVVTDRTMALIHESRGFDHYLLKTPACDLKSELALKLKRQMLQSLQTDCANIDSDEHKRKRVVGEFKKYLEPYTPEEVDWYGLTYAEAITKIKRIQEAQERIVPLKLEFRSQLIAKLKEAGIAEASGAADAGGVSKENSDHLLLQ